MDIRSDINTYLFAKNEDGTVEQQMTFLFSRSGYGKTLSTDGIIEEYKKLGFVILILSDVKDEFESAFAMFKPKKPYHLLHLRKIGKQISTQEVKIYHPFTFNIPTNVLLPEIKFYGFSIKEDLKRSEWSMLAESAGESDTIRLLINACENLGPSDSLHTFLHNMQEMIVGKKEKKKFKPDPKNFYLRTTSATGKSLQDVSSYLQPFRKNYFLLADNSPFNLDWKSILNDTSCYHFFTSYWIGDEKLKDFCIAALFNSILRNKKYAKKPLLIVIPEIRKLVPFKPEGYKKFLAEGMKANLSVMRNMGRGMSGLFDSQIWSDVDEDVRNSATITFFGEMGGAGDIEKISKAMNYKREIRDKLKKMEYRNSYFVQGREDLDTFVLWFPSHSHKEPEYNFFEEYKQFYPERMMQYNHLVDTFKKNFTDEENKIKEKIKRMIYEEKAQQEAMKLEREQKLEKPKDEMIDKLKEEKKLIESKSKEDKKRLLYENKLSEPHLSFRDLGEKYGVSNHTAKSWYDEYKKIDEAKKETESKVDFEEKVLDDLNKTEEKKDVE